MMGHESLALAHPTDHPGMDCPSSRLSPQCWQNRCVRSAPPPRCPFQARRCQQAAGMEHHSWVVREDWQWCQSFFSTAQRGAGVCPGPHRKAQQNDTGSCQHLWPPLWTGHFSQGMAPFTHSTLTTSEVQEVFPPF